MLYPLRSTPCLMGCQQPDTSRVMCYSWRRTILSPQTSSTQLSCSSNSRRRESMLLKYLLSWQPVVMPITARVHSVTWLAWGPTTYPLVTKALVTRYVEPLLVYITHCVWLHFTLLLPSLLQVRVEYFDSGQHNMGFGMDRSFWQTLKGCSKVGPCC